MSSLLNITPIDGRYAVATQELQPVCSEFGLIKARAQIEIAWFITLLKLLHKPSAAALLFLRNLSENFSLNDAQTIKHVEKHINHDSKAVEYFLKQKIATHKKLAKYSELIHFGCTSEDITNIAYALMIKEVCSQHLLPQLRRIIQKIGQLAQKYADQPMLARTHGQIATPTTMGKELANFVMRLKKQAHILQTIKITAKFNGTVGNFNAHVCAYPKIDWLRVSRNFVKNLGLAYNSHTTQIEPHDYVAELSDSLKRCNHILIDLNRDLWGYLALGYFRQKALDAEIGSSVMPHKINPIDFENSEGNLGLANSLLQHFSDKLLISRWQRDLSDSTVLRNLGSSFAYTLIAYKSLAQGLDKLELNREQLNRELEQHWEVLAEAIQTTMRRFGIKNSYEQLKALTRGQPVTRKTVRNFIAKLPLPRAAKQSLRQLTPATYLGLAVKLAKSAWARKFASLTSGI